jgi:hypothetical protein
MSVGNHVFIGGSAVQARISVMPSTALKLDIGDADTDEIAQLYRALYLYYSM